MTVSNGKKKKKKSLREKSYLDLLDDSTCVFCNNVNVNPLDSSHVFWTSPLCLHQVCCSCYDTVFINKREIQCPKCQQKIKRIALVKKGVEQLEFEREKEVRHEVMSEFNLVEDDFDTIEQFYDYQELAETIIYNKVNRINLSWCEDEVLKNRRNNRAAIARNTSKHSQHIQLQKKMVEEERQKALEQLRAVEEKEALLRKEQALEKEELIRVKLGELSATTLQRQNQAKAKELPEENELKKEYTATHHLPSASAQALARMQMLQPKPVDPQPTRKDSNNTAQQNKASEKIASGFDPTAARKRTLELAKACLLVTG